MMNNNLNVPQRAGFTLPDLDNSSSSSLMDAVVGGQQRPGAAAGSPMLTLHESTGGPLSNASRRVNGATGNNNNNNNNNNNTKEVTELERNLQKRRSLIPHLENELAELEAQIKAAEERLAQAASTGPAAATAQ